MQCAKVSGQLGQETIYESPINQYSEKSLRPPAFLSEEDMVNTGLIKNLRHRYDTSSAEAHPGTIFPPPIPKIDDEHPRLLAEHNRILWPRTDNSWSYPSSELGYLSQEPKKDGNFLEWLMSKLGVTSLPDLVEEMISPKNRWGWIAGGGVLMAVAQMKRLRSSFANPVLTGIGGILLGIGLLPIIFEATASAAPPKGEKK
jgi:hypothetical protein